MIVMIIGVMLLVSGIVVGYLLGVHVEDKVLLDECRICREKDERILELEHELGRYKRWIDKVISIYKMKHIDEEEV